MSVVHGGTTVRTFYVDRDGVKGVFMGTWIVRICRNSELYSPQRVQVRVLLIVCRYV